MFLWEKALTISVNSNNSDVVTCSIERKDDCQRKRKNIIRDIVSQKEERKTECGFLLKEKEKKEHFRDLVSKKKREKIHVWTLV